MREQGIVVHTSARGFAFVRPHAGGDDVFISNDAIARAGLTTLHRGQRVAYDLVQDRHHGRGPRQLTALAALGSVPPTSGYVSAVLGFVPATLRFSERAFS